MCKNFDESSGLEPVNAQWIQSFINRLKKTFNLHKVLLFGSRAENEHNCWSDYDICVVSDSFKGLKPFERMEKVLEYWDGGRPLEPICLTVDEFDNPRSEFTVHIKEKGKVLFS